MPDKYEELDGDDPGLPHELTKPSWIDVSSWNYSTTWCFGPQGHPASMRIHLDAFEEEGWKFYMYMSGPTRHHTFNDRQEFKGTEYLTKLLTYGKKIDDKFGKLWSWHRCSEGCSGYKYDAPPPYKRCVDCELIRTQAIVDTDLWLEENPPPTTGE